MSKNMHLTYIALLHRAKKKSAYGVFFPDFAGCVFAGSDMDAAFG